MKNKLKILKKYREKVLGIGQDKNYFIDDFLDTNVLLGFIYEICDHESNLTQNGFNFLKEYYGIEGVVSMIQKDGGELADESPHEILNWLKSIIGGKKKNNIKERMIKFGDKDIFYVIQFKKSKR